ncbi:MAG: hypothetical protein O9322_15920 [Beijerinckiaceae bacterium]|nr:hypothetical protein [Beijerinckiaceae bacterium]MCZ8300839.1 hypothetical protein [Beijerinckiaceae bacterium]
MSAWANNRFSYVHCALTGTLLSAIFAPTVSSIFAVILQALIDLRSVFKKPLAFHIDEFVLSIRFAFSYLIVPAAIGGAIFSILNKFFYGRWLLSFMITWLILCLSALIFFLDFIRDPYVIKERILFPFVIVFLTPVACLNAYLIHRVIDFLHSDTRTREPAP